MATPVHVVHHHRESDDESDGGSIDSGTISAFVEKVIRHGHAVIAHIEGTLLMVCCSITRVVLYIYDLSCLPFRWMRCCLGSAIDWATRQPRGVEDGNRLESSTIPRTTSNLATNAPDVETGTSVKAQDVRHTEASTLPLVREDESTELSRLTAHAMEVPCCSLPSISKLSREEQAEFFATRLASVQPSFPLETPETPLLQESTPICSTTGSTSSDGVDYMPFELGTGEEQKEASIVPSSVEPSSSGRPARWSIDYLAHNADGGRAMIVGGGSFAKVGIMTHKGSGGKMAVKAIPRIDSSSNSSDGFINMEIRTLQEGCAHPNVVDLLGYIKTTLNAYIIMPMVAADLFEVMQDGPMTEANVQALMRALVSALEFLHAKNIVHRDVKPANILIAEDDTPLLADFGFAAIIPRNDIFITGPACGTRSYMSPEQLSGEEKVTVSVKVDMWGLGVVAYEVIHGTTPFRPIEDRSLGHEIGYEETKGGDSSKLKGSMSLESYAIDDLEVSNILTAPVIFDEGRASADCKDFISKLLERRAEDRPSACIVADHPWLGGPEVANEIRANALNAVATREEEMRADRARLMKRTRRVVRRPQP